MQRTTLKQQVRDLSRSTPVTIFVIVLTAYLVGSGWSGKAMMLVFIVLWIITDRIYTRDARKGQAPPERLEGREFDLLHNRIFFAVFVCLAIYQAYGLENIWIPIVMCILWEIGRWFIIRNRKA
jgi:hypothetical protein